MPPPLRNLPDKGKFSCDELKSRSCPTTRSGKRTIGTVPPRSKKALIRISLVAQGELVVSRTLADSEDAQATLVIYSNSYSAVLSAVAAEGLAVVRLAEGDNDNGMSAETTSKLPSLSPSSTLHKGSSGRWLLRPWWTVSRVPAAA